MSLSKETEEKLMALQRQLLLYCLLYKKTGEKNPAILARIQYMKTAISIIQATTTGGGGAPPNPIQPIPNPKAIKSRKKGQPDRWQGGTIPTGTSQIDVEPAKIAAAETLLTAYIGKVVTQEQFDHYTKQEFIDSLRVRINNPGGMQQGTQNLCGPAAFAVNWIERDPEGYVKTMIDVFELGKGTYKDITLKINTSMWKQKVKEYYDSSGGPNPQELVDWLTISALQGGSGYFGYNPDSEWGGMRGMVFPWKMLDWLKNLSNDEVKEYWVDFAPSKLNEQYNNANTIVFLVYADAVFSPFNPKKQFGDDPIEKKESSMTSITGNHYVILNSPITTSTKDGVTLLEIDLWSWGENYHTTITEADFKQAVKSTFVIPPETP